MSWLQVSLPATGDAVPAVTAAMESAGALAVTTTPAQDAPVLEPAPGQQPLARHNRVTGLFEPAAAGGAAICAALMRELGPQLQAPPAVSVLEDAQWERAWRQQAVARAFGEGLWVLPHDAPAPPGARAVLRLDPGLAFGTGAHPTTSLCLQWLAQQPVAGRTVIDYGCGSGILAVAAALLGAQLVFAVDHDPQALRATADNAAGNAVAQRVRITDDPPPADLLVANILANALTELADRFAALVRPGGALALSGILPEQADGVSRRYARAFRLDAPRRDGDWVLLCGTRV